METEATTNEAMYWGRAGIFLVGTLLASECMSNAGNNIHLGVNHIQVGSSYDMDKIHQGTQPRVAGGNCGKHHVTASLGKRGWRHWTST